MQKPHHPKGHFPETVWSVVIRAGSSDPSRAIKALGQLCEIYRQPIYTWLCTAGYDHHRAEDAVQDLLQHLLSRPRLNTLSPQEGRFRTYLLTCLRNLLNDQRDARAAVKRGGGAEIWHNPQIEVPVQGDSCEQALDREFALVVKQRALAAVHQAWGKRERLKHFELLRQFILSTPENGTYAQVGPQLGLSPGQVKRAVFDLREQFLDAFRAEVARTVTPEELQEEVKHLVGILHSTPEHESPAG